MAKTNSAEEVSARPAPQKRKSSGLRRLMTGGGAEKKKQAEKTDISEKPKEVSEKPLSQDSETKTKVETKVEANTGTGNLPQKRGRGRPTTSEPPRELKNARIRSDYVEVFRKCFLRRKIDEPKITEGKIFEEALELYFDKHGIDYEK